MSTSSFSPEDLLRFELVRDLDVSPDGSEIAIEKKIIDEKADDYRSSICVVPTSGGDTIELVPATSMNTYPRWSPDGKRLAFLSTRGGPAALYTIRRDGGEARLMKAFKSAISAFVWAPDGRRVLATVAVKHHPDRPKHAPRHITRQRYKSDSVGDLLESTTRLYWIDLESGESTELTDGQQEVMMASLSPDGRRIAYSRSRAGVRDAHITDIWVMDADGSNARQLTTNIPSATAPSWSPDGRLVAFTGNTEIGDSMSSLWIVSANDANGKPRSVGGELVDVMTFPLTRTRPPEWSADGKTIYVVNARRGQTEVAAIDLQSDTCKTLIDGDGQIGVFHIGGKQLAFVRVSASEPGDVFVAPVVGGDARVVTKLNPWWRDRTPMQMKRVRFSETNEGWLMEAAGATASPAPLFVDVHGGPQSIAELAFPYHVYWWVLCSRGWRVLALNPLGSNGYGAEHARAVRSAWGERDFPQQLEAIDALQAQGLVDDRIVIGGKSYGGFMAAWAIGHTDRFKAAIVSAPVANFESHAGTSDSGYYVDPYDLEGEVYEKRDLARRLSPVQYVHRATTPTLLLQGEQDLRCPMGQSEELFSVMMRVGKAPVEMVLYPEGHHDVAEDGRPSHRVDYHGRVVEWAERWTSKPIRNKQ